MTDPLSPVSPLWRFTVPRNEEAAIFHDDGNFIIMRRDSGPWKYPSMNSARAPAAATGGLPFGRTQEVCPGGVPKLLRYLQFQRGVSVNFDPLKLPKKQ